MEPFEKFFRALSSVSLLEREKLNMRISIQAHMRSLPIRRVTEPTLLKKTASYIESLFNSKILAAHPAFAAYVLVVFIGIGTVYASERALPGEPLYAFKTRVNEPVQGVLALSPEARTEWSAELTFRRLQEAEELAATGNLSPVASADIESGLQVALEKFSESVAMLESDDDVRAANAHSDLEAALSAHEVVLASLPTTEKSSTERVTSAVQKHVKKVSQMRFLSEATLTATDSPAVKNAALKQKKFAQDAVQEVQLMTSLSADPTMASSAVSITAVAQSDIEAGESEAENGHWGKAFSAFQDATRKVKETKKGAQTRSWLKSRFGIGATSTATTTLTTNATTTITDATTTATTSKGIDNKTADDDEEKKDSSTSD